MKVFISLDYEVFFFKPSSDIKQSLIAPTERFLEILSKTQSKAVFFVDAGYLYALKRQQNKFDKLAKDYAAIVVQLQYIETQGYEIALHIHPHWEDSYYDGHRWKMNLNRYKLADYTKVEAEEIFKKYYRELQSILVHQIVSYRAGGWCIEPFDYIKDAMKEVGIYIDSTVYQDGYAKTATHNYDFRKYPKKEFWRFSSSPAIEDKEGCFFEIAFTSQRFHPILYWKVLFNTLLKRIKKEGNGQGVKPSFKEVLKKLFTINTEPVSIDAFKSQLLLKAFKNAEKKGKKYFCVIGHPKCFSEDTYKNLEQFLAYAKHRGHTIATFSKLITADRVPQQQTSILY
jgi:hypothetical protein